MSTMSFKYTSIFKNAFEMLFTEKFETEKGIQLIT